MALFLFIMLVQNGIQASNLSLNANTSIKCGLALCKNPRIFEDALQQPAALQIRSTIHGLSDVFGYRKSAFTVNVQEAQCTVDHRNIFPDKQVQEVGFALFRQTTIRTGPITFEFSSRNRDESWRFLDARSWWPWEIR